MAEEKKRPLNPAEQRSCETIEAALGDNPAFRKLDDRIFALRQGSTHVVIKVIPLPGGGGASIRCVAQVAKGVSFDLELAGQLLALNSVLSFGSFAYVKGGDMVLLVGSLLGGETLDSAELVNAVRRIAMTADHWDDKIIERFGGQRAQDLLEETVVGRMLADAPDAF